MATTTTNSIRRKPVPVLQALALSDSNNPRRAGRVESPSAISSSPPAYDDDNDDDDDEYNAATSLPADNLGVDNESASPPTNPTASASAAASKVLKQALSEARYFAGGLVTHPHESTRHYSIQRHSHNFVYYAGHYTSLALTVFADAPLPPARSYWLQRRGFSGQSGLAIGALMAGSSSSSSSASWVDVTPAVQVAADQISPADERAYQRDIGRFLRRAQASKKTSEHLPRETCVLRIPCYAQDGYLRVVLCAGGGSGSGGHGSSKRTKLKPLCASPVFRLFSASTDSSSVRGASLKTLPLEIGIKVSSKIANTAARSAVTATAGPLVSSAKQYVGSQVTAVLQPTGLQTDAASLLYDQAASSVADRVAALKAEAAAAREEQCKPVFSSSSSSAGICSSGGGSGGDLLDPQQPAVIGVESGPTEPFPRRFHGRVVRGLGRRGGHEAARMIPTATLADINDSDISLRYAGVYIGWAAISLPKSKSAAAAAIDTDWHEAIIYIAPQPLDNGSSRTESIVQTRSVQVHILQDFEGATFFDARLSLIMMGFLRPGGGLACSSSVAARTSSFMHDAACASASLGRPERSAEAALAQMRAAKSSRSTSERCVDVMQGAQRSIDKAMVPLDRRLCVRTGGRGYEQRDRLIGNGGVWIKRD